MQATTYPLPPSPFASDYVSTFQELADTIDRHVAISFDGYDRQNMREKIFSHVSQYVKLEASWEEQTIDGKKALWDWSIFSWVRNQDKTIKRGRITEALQLLRHVCDPNTKDDVLIASIFEVARCAPKGVRNQSKLFDESVVSLFALADLLVHATKTNRVNSYESRLTEQQKYITVIEANMDLRNHVQQLQVDVQQQQGTIQEQQDTIQQQQGTILQQQDSMNDQQDKVEELEAKIKALKKMLNIAKKGLLDVSSDVDSDFSDE